MGSLLSETCSCSPFIHQSTGNPSLTSVLHMTNNWSSPQSAGSETCVICFKRLSPAPPLQSIHVEFSKDAGWICYASVHCNESRGFSAGLHQWTDMMSTSWNSSITGHFSPAVGLKVFTWAVIKEPEDPQNENIFLNLDGNIMRLSRRYEEELLFIEKMNPR